MRWLRTRVGKVALPFALTLAAVLGTGLVLIKRLPNVYESRARIAIERPDAQIVGNEDSDQDALAQRLQIIIESVLRRDGVVTLLARHELIGPGSDLAITNAAVAEFRDAAVIEIANVSVVNPYTGKLGLMPFGIDVAYRTGAPAVAYAVASSLVAEVLSANTGRNQTTTDETSVFLEAEVAEHERVLADIEQRIADFKDANLRYLPELYPVAVRRLEDLDRQIENSNNRVSDLRRDRSEVSAELATSSPEALMFAPDGTRIEGTDEQLARLRLDYGMARAKYSDDHPEVVRLAREIGVLERVGGTIDTADLERRLADTRAELAAARKRYSQYHPDTVRLIREELALKRELNEAVEQASSVQPRTTSVPSSPAYNRVLVEQRGVEDSIDEEQRRLDSLTSSIDDINAQLALMPRVEQRLVDLTRQRDAETVAYKEIVTRLTGSRLNSGLRQASLLDRLTLLEPPVESLEPIAPHRSLIAAALAFFAVALAIVVALVIDWRRDALWTSGDVRELTDSDVELIPRFA